MKNINAGFDFKSLDKDGIVIEFEKILEKLACGDEFYYDGTY